MSENENKILKICPAEMQQNFYLLHWVSIRRVQMLQNVELREGMGHSGGD